MWPFWLFLGLFALFILWRVGGTIYHVNRTSKPRGPLTRRATYKDEMFDDEPDRRGGS